MPTIVTKKDWELFQEHIGLWQERAMGNQRSEKTVPKKSGTIEKYLALGSCSLWCCKILTTYRVINTLQDRDKTKAPNAVLFLNTVRQVLSETAPGVRLL